MSDPRTPEPQPSKPNSAGSEAAGSEAAGSHAAGPQSLNGVLAAIVALALGGFGIGVTEFTIMGLLQEATVDLGVSIPEGGHIISAYALGVVIGAPVLTVVGAKMPRKTLALWLMALFVVANFSSFIAPTYEWMLVSRVLSGLPHGAYFGVAAIVAASLVSPGKRGQAVAWVMLGLSVANVVGVPLVTWLGQEFGWRVMFVAVGLIGIVTWVAIKATVPFAPGDRTATLRGELSAFSVPGVWLAMLTGVIGFGGFFAVYSYISPIMTDVTGLPISLVPMALGIYGVGMVVGNLVGGRLSDWSVSKTVYLAMIYIAGIMVVFWFASPYVIPALILVFLAGTAGSLLIPSLQTLLMDAAPRAQSLAAALNHSALNVANALGAYLGGAVIAAGWGLRAPALVGAGLAVVGLFVAVLAVRSVRKSINRADRVARREVLDS